MCSVLMYIQGSSVTETLVSACLPVKIKVKYMKQNDNAATKALHLWRSLANYLYQCLVSGQTVYFLLHHVNKPTFVSPLALLAVCLLLHVRP
jgi:hypothetical protein